MFQLYIKNNGGNSGKTIAVEVDLDGISHMMDRTDLFKLYWIASTYFDVLPEPMHDETNHQKVMENIKK